MKKSKNQQVCLRLPTHIIDELRRTARMRRTSQSAIVETALKNLLSETEHGDVVERRLNRLQRQYEGMRGEQKMLLETLATFIKVYLTHTPAISSGQKQEAESLGAQRFERFVQIIQGALGSEQGFADLLSEQVFEEDDFVSDNSQSEEVAHGY